MDNFSLFLTALDAIKEWFDSLESSRHLNDENYQQAIATSYTALNETKIYVGSLNRRSFRPKQNEPRSRSRRDEQTEARLSRLWTEASLKIRVFDYDLANRCLLKSDYWTHPYNWSDEDVEKARIQIDRVFRDAQRLL